MPSDKDVDFRDFIQDLKKMLKEEAEIKACWPVDFPRNCRVYADKENGLLEIFFVPVPDFKAITVKNSNTCLYVDKETNELVGVCIHGAKEALSKCSIGMFS